MTTQPFRDALAYQRWATERLARWIEVLPDGWLDEPISGSFPTVRASLLHMADAERIWMQRLQGQSPKTWPSQQAGAVSEPFADYLRRSTAAFADHADRQSDPWFAAWCTFADFTAAHHRIVNGGIVQHVVNHTSFHRGQVIGQVRQLADRAGGTTSMPAIPGTDYITWLREQNPSLPGADPDLERIYGG